MSKQLSLPLPEKDTRPRLKMPDNVKMQAHEARVLLRHGKGKDLLEKMRDLGASLERFERRIKNK